MKRLLRNLLPAGLALFLLLPAESGIAAVPATLLVWGDSLSAGYGLDANTGWVHLLEQRLQTQAGNWKVVNGSVSGETSAGGLARLPEALQHYRPQLILIELGANDGLRGQSLAAMRGNLERMIDDSLTAGARPLLLEMRIPPNYGADYTGRFTQVFDDVAAARKIPLVPFFLAPVAGDRNRWFQDDGLHPNAQAQPLLLDAVWPTLAPQLKPAVHP